MVQTASIVLKNHHFALHQPGRGIASRTCVGNPHFSGKSFQKLHYVGFLAQPDRKPDGRPAPLCDALTTHFLPCAFGHYDIVPSKYLLENLLFIGRAVLRLVNE